MSKIYLYFALGNTDMILTCEYDGHILAYPVASAIRTANPGKYLMPPGAGQGSRNSDILASGMGGNGDRKRKWEGKCYQQGLKLIFFALHRVKNGPNRT